MTPERFSHLQQLMDAYKLDTVVINPGPTLTYLTGLHFHLMERPTLFIYHTGKQPVLILPALELGKAESSRILLKPFTFQDDPATWPGVIQNALNELGLDAGKVAVEPTRLRFLEIDFLQHAAPALDFVNGDMIFSPLCSCGCNRSRDRLATNH
jgi:Xaa-Pro dipeptidase